MQNLPLHYRDLTAYQCKPGALPQSYRPRVQNRLIYQDNTSGQYSLTEIIPLLQYSGFIPLGGTLPSHLYRNRTAFLKSIYNINNQVFLLVIVVIMCPYVW